MLHWLFKQAWHGAASLPVYGTGSNVIPLIHVRDLASIVLNVLDSKPKRKYILAVDQRYFCLTCQFNLGKKFPLILYRLSQILLWCTFQINETKFQELSESEENVEKSLFVIA